MKPTRILTLVWNTVATTILAAIIVYALIGAGLAVPVSGINLLLTMPAIAIIDLALVWPILRYKKGLADYLLGVNPKRPKRPEPFYAVRVLLISKSSAIAGAWFLGWHVGVVIVQLNTGGLTDSVWRQVFGAVGSLLLIVAGLISERGCRLPDDGDDQASELGAKGVGVKPAGPAVSGRAASGKAAASGKVSR